MYYYYNYHLWQIIDEETESMSKLKFSKTTKKSQIDDKNSEVEEIRKQLISCNKEITGELLYRWQAESISRLSKRRLIATSS